ncbi:MAG: hypothetical protein JKY37_06335, partial [Nannocystaceae bacterium]|nr:hypothetical protein [Nannocystaceae bacterium]
MFRAASVLACALLLSAAGCGKADPNTAATSGIDRTPAPNTARRDAQTLSALASFGDNGALLVVVRPDAWPRIRSVLMPLLSGIDLPASLDPKHARSPDELAGLILASLGVTTQRVPRITGWDGDRPVTASLFEAGVEGPVGGLTPALIGEASLPTIRHQILVPATDTAALVGSLARLVEAFGAPWPDLVDGTPGAKAVRVGKLAIAIVPEQHRVRIVLVHPIARDSDLAVARARLATSTVDLPKSEAMGLLISRDNFIGALVRPWRLREISVRLGARIVRSALGVSRTNQATMRAHGARALLVSELAMSDAGADFDESAVAIRVVDGVIHLRMVSQLTVHGAAVADAAHNGAGGPFTTKALAPWLQAYLGADLSGLA